MATPIGCAISLKNTPRAAMNQLNPSVKAQKGNITAGNNQIVDDTVRLATMRAGRRMTRLMAACVKLDHSAETGRISKGKITFLT